MFMGRVRLLGGGGVWFVVGVIAGLRVVSFVSSVVLGVE